MSNIKYGIANVEDLPRIIEMKMAMFLEAGHGDLLSPNAASIVLADYKTLYEERKARHFVACADDNVVASVGAFIKTDLPFRYYSLPRYGFIGDVYTDVGFRSRGIASRLNTEALKWFNSVGVKMVRLFASNAARPIYESLGFVYSDEMVLNIET